MSKKAQVSVEFIIAVLLLLSLFLFSLGLFGEKNKGFIYSRESYEAKLTASKIGSAINYVYAAGPGTETRLLLEKNVDFNISISGNSVAVWWRGNFVDSALLTNGITVHSLSQGSWLRVWNENGGIHIENA